MTRLETLGRYLKFRIAIQVTLLLIHLGSSENYLVVDRHVV